MNESVPFSKTEPARALIYLFTDRRRYIDAVVAHEMALNLESPELRKLFEEGKYPKPEWEQEARIEAERRAHRLKTGLFSSVRTTSMIFAAGVGMSLLQGKTHPDLPVDLGKVVSAFGGFLAAWATLFELGGYAETYRGKSLHELLHPLIFRVLFLSGVLLAVVGQLWWQ